MVSDKVIKVYVEKTKKRHITRSGDSREIDSYDPLYRMLYIYMTGDLIARNIKRSKQRRNSPMGISRLLLR